MPPLPKSVSSKNPSAKEAMMSQVHGIGTAANKLYAELADRLAGPLQAFLPATWIGQALGEMGHRFRQAASSPHVMLWAFIGQVLDPDHDRNARLR